jgi:RNA polymerase sigma factor (sigma-70 family)
MFYPTANGNGAGARRKDGMGTPRIVYRNWVVEHSRDKAQESTEDSDGPADLEIVSLDTLAGERIADLADGSTDEKTDRVERIKKNVTRAMAQLTAKEREFVILFYYAGMTLREISERSGRPMHRIKGLQTRALKRLKKELGPFVTREFGIGGVRRESCLICNSPRRAEIDRLIGERDPRSSWRSTIRTLRTEFGVRVTRPTQLIGHEKYH